MIKHWPSHSEYDSHVTNDLSKAPTFPMINAMAVICNDNRFILVANLLYEKHVELTAYTELLLLSNHFAVISKNAL